MTTFLADLQSQALELSPDERVALADHLLASLGTDGEIETVWSKEVERGYRPTSACAEAS